MRGSVLDELYLTPAHIPTDFRDFAETACTLRTSISSSSAPSIAMPLKYDGQPEFDQENFAHDPHGDRLEYVVKDIHNSSTHRKSPQGLKNSKNDSHTRYKAEQYALYNDDVLHSRRESSPEPFIQTKQSSEIGSSQSSTKVSSPSGLDQAEDEGTDHRQAKDFPIFVGKTTESIVVRGEKSQKRKAAGSVVNVDDKPFSAGRHLRQRKPAQYTPYRADKVNWQSQRQKGHNVTKEEIDKTLISQTKALTASKRPTGRNRPAARGTSALGVESTPHSTAQSSELDHDFMMDNTILRIAVKNRDGAIEIPLGNVASLSLLIEYINDRWGSVYGSTVDHLVCERPWKADRSDLVMYPKWDDQFGMFTDSIAEAKVWKEKAPFKLEVTMVVALKDATRTDIELTPEMFVSTPSSKS